MDFTSIWRVRGPAFLKRRPSHGHRLQTAPINNPSQPFESVTGIFRISSKISRTPARVMIYNTRKVACAASRVHPSFACSPCGRRLSAKSSWVRGLRFGSIHFRGSFSSSPTCGQNSPDSRHGCPRSVANRRAISSFPDSEACCPRAFPWASSARARGGRRSFVAPLHVVACNACNDPQ